MDSEIDHDHRPSSINPAKSRHLTSAARVALAVGFCIASCGLAAADSDPRPFYQGKTVQIVVGFDAGGGYDAYTRLIARHISRFIPGNPTIIVQNMPGAGSRVAANWLYNVAAKDGTILGSIVQGTPVDQVFKESGVRFDASKFNWIGNPIVDNLVSLSTDQSGLKTMENVRSKGGLICGSSGAGPTVMFSNAIGRLLSSNVRLVAGYPGVNAITLAMQRNEVNCNAGQAWSSAKATMSQQLREKEFRVLVQWGTEADPDISAVAGTEVPLITNYARSDADKGALRLLASTSALSRPLLAPPGLPLDRVALLRRAFDQTMQDPGFLEDAKKAVMDIKPIGGAAIQSLVESVVNTPQDEVTLAAQLAK